MAGTVYKAAAPINFMHSHDTYMRIALKEAWKAYENEEVPVGAVIVDQRGEMLSKAYNETISRNDPTAHAEILALRRAAEVIKNYRLLDARIYVTIEPCIMCAGALIHARVSEIIFGALDKKWGGLFSLYQLAVDDRLNHQPKVTGGVLEADCAEMMKRFFKEKRRPPEDESLDLIIIEEE